MRGSGTIQLRLSGESGIIAAIFSALSERLPRGPRGGSLYRLSLRENQDGVSSRLYTDLPAAVFSDLFQGAAASRSTPPVHEVAKVPGTAPRADPVPALPPPRYRIGYKAEGGTREAS